MYHDIKATYWWNGLKKDVAKFIALCLTYQQVKLEHQRSRTANARMEMGPNHHGFCGRATQDTEGV